MSVNEWDARQEEALEALYEEHKQLAIEEFTSERLQSFYLSHPDLALPPRAFLDESKLLLEKHPTAAQMMAASAIAVTIKGAFLRPLVHGLVHSEPLAGFITETALKQTGVSRFRDLLFEILLHLASLDLRTLVRAGARCSLWKEVQEDSRNRALHRAERLSAEDAERAILVCSELLDVFWPALLKGLGLHTHDRTSICVERFCPKRYLP